MKQQYQKIMNNSKAEKSALLNKQKTVNQWKQ